MTFAVSKKNGLNIKILLIYQVLSVLEVNLKRVKKHAGGVLKLYKSQISDGITRMPSTNKHFIWMKLNSDFFGLEEDIFVCGLYIPPSNSEYFKNQDIDLFDQLKSDLVEYN